MDKKKKLTKEEKAKRRKTFALAMLASTTLWYNTNKESQYQNDKILTNIEEIKEKPNNISEKQLNKTKQELQALLETSRNENYNLIVEKVSQAFSVENADVSIIEDEKDKENVGISVSQNEETYEYRKKLNIDKTEKELKEEKRTIKELPEEMVELLDDYNWINDTIVRFDKENLTEKQLEEIEKELKVVREYYVDCKDMIVKISGDGSLNITSFTKETKEEKRENVEEEKNTSQGDDSKNAKVSFENKYKVKVPQLKRNETATNNLNKPKEDQERC